jgi:ABC-type iron transport system FetAB ATPase subunit
MKNLIIINGTMGVGKTATCKMLLKLLPNCVLLDGDWCWYADPWTVTDETKIMAEKNMSFLLNNYLDCSIYENIIFCWVLHVENMVDMVCSWVKDKDFISYKFSLVCSESALLSRLQNDIENGERENDILKRSLQRLPNYINMDTIKIDVSDITPKQAAHQISDFVYPAV